MSPVQVSTSRAFHGATLGILFGIEMEPDNMNAAQDGAGNRKDAHHTSGAVSPSGAMSTSAAMSAPSADTCWQGGSNHRYPARPVPLDSFQLREDHVYLLAISRRPLWVGTAHDLVCDSDARTRFRQALDMATCAYELNDPGNEGARISLMTDLMAGHPSRTLAAA